MIRALKIATLLAIIALSVRLGWLLHPTTTTILIMVPCDDRIPVPAEQNTKEM